MLYYSQAYFIYYAGMMLSSGNIRGNEEKCTEKWGKVTNFLCLKWKITFPIQPIVKIENVDNNFSF